MTKLGEEVGKSRSAPVDKVCGADGDVVGTRVCGVVVDLLAEFEREGWKEGILRSVHLAL